MSIEERAIMFPCDVDHLVAIVSRPQHPLHRGILIVVGGPQYRVGSHRQFTLLCRALAKRGFATMRFDYRGMGDSEGAVRNFEDIVPDIRAAVDQFFLGIPELREVVIWGLCDAASAALMYAYRDVRITGLVLVNPWVRTSVSYARTQLKHYYWSRITSDEFWRKLMRGEFAFRASVRSFASMLLTTLGICRRGAKVDNLSAQPNSGGHATGSLPERMADGLSRFRGRALVILSGNDLTAQEFEAVVQKSLQWGKLLSDQRVEHRKLPEANHTFSTQRWRDQVATLTVEWVGSW